MRFVSSFYYNTKIKNRDILFWEACEQELSFRESDPPMERWFCNDGDGADYADEGFSYCLDCIMVLLPGAKSGDDYCGAYPAAEADSPARCERCGKLLRYCLTDFGFKEELAQFEEDGWDWNRPDDCYEVYAVMGASPMTDDYRKRIIRVLKRGRNRPAELKMHIKQLKMQHWLEPTLKSDPKRS